MTPEEILGIPTPEKILGITDPDNDPSLSPEERFLRRRDRESEMGESNAMRHAETSLWQSDASNPFQPTDEKARFTGTLADSLPGSPLDLKALFGRHPAESDDAAQKADSAWDSPFDTVQPLPKPTPEQLAGMERFRALMDPPAADLAPASSASAQPAAPSDPYLQPLPTFNPAGQSVAPLAENISKPTGIMPLPTATGPAIEPTKVTPLVQPPPWLQNPVQSGVFQQRQF